MCGYILAIRRKLCSIDKGAQVSVLPRYIYDSLPENDRQPLRSTKLQIKLADDVDLTCFGVSRVIFQLQGEKYECDMHIVDDSVQPILGEDFLATADDSDPSPCINNIRFMVRPLNFLIMIEIEYITR